MSRSILGGSTDQSTIIRALDSSGDPVTTLVYNTSGLVVKYRREGSLPQTITLATLADAEAAHTDGGFIHIENGYYRVDLPDAAVAGSNTGVLITGTGTGVTFQSAYHPLVAYNPQNADSLGLSRIDAAISTRGTYSGGNITGNLSGSVGSVTGNVGGNVTGSVGSIATNGITAASVQADAVTKIQAGLPADVADAVWDEDPADHETADTFGALIAAITPTAIATAVWNVLTSTLTTVGSVGLLVKTKLGLIQSANTQIEGIPVGRNNVFTLYQGDIKTLNIDYDATTNDDPVHPNTDDNGSLASFRVNLSISKLANNTNTATGEFAGAQYACTVVDAGAETQAARVSVNTASWVPSITPWAEVTDWVSPENTYAYQWELSVNNGQSGTAQAGSSTTITLSATASAEDDFYNGLEITLTGGTGVSATPVTITDYDGSTKVATVASWPAGTPDATTTYTIAPDICEVIKAGFFHVRSTTKTCT